MSVLAFWCMVSFITYFFIKYGYIGADIFQHNLKVEGCDNLQIQVFVVCFSIFWPLWWFGMCPIVVLIGRKEKKTNEKKEKV